MKVSFQRINMSIFAFSKIMSLQMSPMMSYKVWENANLIENKYNFLVDEIKKIKSSEDIDIESKISELMETEIDLDINVIDKVEFINDISKCDSNAISPDIFIVLSFMFS